MAKNRFIKEFSCNTAKVSIFYNSEFSEYICRVFREGRHYKPADYVTECWYDAKQTARSMLDEELERIERNSKPAEPGCFAPEYADIHRAFTSRLNNF